jgi:hypothetical protein
VVFAKPWETRHDPALIEAKAQTAQKPWDPKTPPVKQEIIQAHEQRTVQNGQVLAIDQIKAQAFAKNYLIDFDHRNAAIVTFGYTDAERARQVGLDYIRHPFVLQALQAYMSRIEQEKLVSRERILLGLLQEANYHGVGSSHSARVAAWRGLSKIMGMETEKPEEDLTKKIKGGVMLVPYAGGIEAWEASARGQQAQLKADVRT